MSEGAPAPKLPLLFRLAVALCLLLSGVEGMLAAQQAFALARPAALSEAALDPQPEATRVANEAFLKAAAGSAETREVIVTAFALVCSLTFVAAARLLRPGPLPREGMRRFLVMGTVLAAFLATLDGAQLAVFAHRAGAALQQFQGAPPPGVSPEDFARAQPLLPSLMTGATALITAVLAGLFAALSVYFSSTRVKALIAARDQELNG